MGNSPLLPKANQEDEPIKKMTADEALKAYIARFGFIPWGLRHFLTMRSSGRSRRPWRRGFPAKTGRYRPDASCNRL